MYFVYVYLDFMNTCSTLLQTKLAHGNRAENRLGRKIPVVLDLTSLDSHNKQTYEIVFRLTCLKYGLTLQCAEMHISYSFCENRIYSLFSCEVLSNHLPNLIYLR